METLRTNTQLESLFNKVVSSCRVR